MGVAAASAVVVGPSVVVASLSSTSSVSSFKVIWVHCSSNIGGNSCFSIWINGPLNNMETSDVLKSTSE